MYKQLLHRIVVCIFALSAVTPISAMTALRSSLVRALARHSSPATMALPRHSLLATTGLARNSSLATTAVARNGSLVSKAARIQHSSLMSKAVSPQLHNASRALQIARTKTTTPHTISLLQRPAFGLSSLVRGATRSRIPDAHARVLNLVQRRSFSITPLINSISTEAVGLAVSAAAAAITWYMDDGVPGGLKAAIEYKDAYAIRRWLAAHEMTAEEKMYVAHYCVKHGYAAILSRNPGGMDVFLALAEHVFAELIALEHRYGGRQGVWFLGAMAQNHTGAAEVFTPLAAQHFAELVSSDVTMLEDIINNYAPAAEVFTPLAAQHFKQLIGDFWRCRLIDTLTMKNRDAAKAFTPGFVECFGELIKSERGRSLIRNNLRVNPDAATAFTPAAVKCFAELVHDSDRLDILSNIVERNPQSVNDFIAEAAEHFMQLSKSYYGQRFLLRIMKNNSSAARRFTQVTVEHFSELVNNPSVSPDVFLEILSCNSDAAKDFTSAAIKNYATIAQGERGKKLLSGLVEINPAVAEDFMQAAQDALIEDDFALILRVRARHARGERLSPSEAHMLANKELVLTNMYGLSKDVQDLQKIVLMDERRAIESGYAPFYHAQSKEKWFPIALDTFLHGVQTGEKVDEFYMMHTQADPLRQQAQKYAQETGGQLHEEIMYDYLKTNDAAQRVKLRKYGRQKEADRKRMLFLNGSLRGNASKYGSQSFPYYFVADLNAGGKYTQSQDILRKTFKDRGLDSVYEEFKDELQQLHEEYIALSKYGTLYQLAVPVDKVNAMVRPVVTGGGAATIDAYGEKTDDMQKIVVAMRDVINHPGDQNEFIATMTYDDRGLMNPKSGVKIKSYMIPKDDAQYAAWQAKWEQVKSRIKATVANQRPADYVAPAHAQELVGLLRAAYENHGGSQ